MHDTSNGIGRGRTVTRLAAICVAVGATVLAPAAAQAEETTCQGTIGAETVDNVRVPDGASCTLVGTTVQGTVKVETEAKMRAKGARVIGNVRAGGGDPAHRLRSTALA